MGQANCCAGKGKEDQVDMERAKQKELSRQKERERRMSEKKKRESAKQGARIREEVEREEDAKYNPDEIETMLPEKTTIHDVKRNTTFLDYVDSARKRLISLWYDNRSDDWSFKKTEEGVDLYSQPCTEDTDVSNNSLIHLIKLHSFYQLLLRITYDFCDLEQRASKYLKFHSVVTSYREKRNLIIFKGMFGLMKII